MASAGQAPAPDASSFRASWQRIDRARAHNKAIADTWASFLHNEEVYDTILEVNSDGTGIVWAEQTAPIPSVIALQVGELLYQLRSALDGTIYSAAILETGQDPPPDHEKLEFPIRPSREDFQKASWKLGPLSEKSRWIVESVQPYHAPPIADQLSYNVILGVLNDWARIDRHRKLHVTRSWCTPDGPVQWTLDKGVSVKEIRAFEAGFLENDNVIAHFRLEGWTPGAKVAAKANAVIDVAIDEPPTPCNPSDYLGLRLEMMIDAVASIVRAFEIRFGIANE